MLQGQNENVHPNLREHRQDLAKSSSNPPKISPRIHALNFPQKYRDGRSWEIKQEGDCLVFRDLKTLGDNRWLFKMNETNSWGWPQHLKKGVNATIDRNPLFQSEDWIVEEEDCEEGALIIRTKEHSGTSYIFHPGYAYEFKGKPTRTVTSEASSLEGLIDGRKVAETTDAGELSHETTGCDGSDSYVLFKGKFWNIHVDSRGILRFLHKTSRSGEQGFAFYPGCGGEANISGDAHLHDYVF